MTEIAAYDPAVHAALPGVARYEGTHVVVGDVPLSDFTFDPADALVPRLAREATDCPRLDALHVTPRTPPIEGMEQQQAVTVPCILRVNVLGTPPYFHGVCAARAEAAGFADAQIPTGVFENNERRVAVECPFSYLIGRLAVPGGGEVKVGVTAEPLDGLDQMKDSY